jgi:hypothetical protein
VASEGGDLRESAYAGACQEQDVTVSCGVCGFENGGVGDAGMGVGVVEHLIVWKTRVFEFPGRHDTKGSIA